jgi:hypothetical protein
MLVLQRYCTHSLIDRIMLTAVSYLWINYCNYHQPTARPTIGTKPPWEHPFHILKNKIYRKRLSYVDVRTYLIKKIPLFLYPYQHIRLVISPVPVWDIFTFQMLWVSNTKVKHKTLWRYKELA